MPSRSKFLSFSALSALLLLLILLVDLSPTSTSLVEASCAHRLPSYSHLYSKRKYKRQEEGEVEAPASEPVEGAPEAVVEGEAGIDASLEKQGAGEEVAEAVDGEEGEEVEPLPNFGYNATSNPLNWHTIENNFAICATGVNQSPIILEHGLIQEAPRGSVKLDIQAQRDVLFENLGTTVEVVVTGTTFAAGENWNLAQFHFHTPSEHRLDSAHFDAELHFVHEAADGSGRIAVVAFLVNVSHRKTTGFLEDVISLIDDIKTPGATTSIKELDLTHLVRQANHGTFFTYSGSLTTPPCSEQVTWFISTASLPLDTRTYLNLKRVVGTNNRFSQSRLGEPNFLQAAKDSIA